VARRGWFSLETRHFVFLSDCLCPCPRVLADLPNHDPAVAFAVGRGRVTVFRSLAKHARNNSIAKVLTTVAGLVSFPALTRVLAVEDYGVMNLIASALTLAVGLGKLGMQQAALRFYSEVRAGLFPGLTLARYTPTVIYGMGLLGLVATMMWLVASALIPQALGWDARVGPLMQLTAVLVLARVLLSGLQNILWAQELSGTLAILTVVHRYISLGLVLGAVFLIAPTLWSFYGATVASEIALLIVIFIWVKRSGTSLDPRAVSKDLFGRMFVFAVPMAGYELASVVLQLSDRYVQNSYLGAESVGLYSAAYNLCDYIRLALFTAMASAVQPMALRMHSESGTLETSKFLDRFTHLYVAGGFLVVASVCAVRVEMLSILASPKYQAASVAVPWLIGGMMCEAYFGIAGIGNYLRKRSLAMMSIIGTGALANVGLNLLLVPRLGIQGSGIANLISCALIVILARQSSKSGIIVPALLAPLLKFGAIAALSYFVAMLVTLSGPWGTLMARCMAIVFVYGGLVCLADAQLRSTLAGFCRRLPFFRPRDGV
jgi:O-antigen/teichoic acid export membrane protein